MNTSSIKGRYYEHLFHKRTIAHEKRKAILPDYQSLCEVYRFVRPGH